MVADSWGAVQKEATASGNTVDTLPIYAQLCGRKLVQGFGNVWVPQFSLANRLLDGDEGKQTTRIGFGNQKVKGSHHEAEESLSIRGWNQYWNISIVLRLPYVEVWKWCVRSATKECGESIRQIQKSIRFVKLLETQTKKSLTSGFRHCYVGYQYLYTL